MGHWLGGFEQEPEEIEYFFVISLQQFRSNGVMSMCGYDDTLFAPPDISEQSLFYAVVEEVGRIRRNRGEDPLEKPIVLSYYVKPNERKG
jgi:hypothetical protein